MCIQCIMVQCRAYRRRRARLSCRRSWSRTTTKAHSIQRVSVFVSYPAEEYQLIGFARLGGTAEIARSMVPIILAAGGKAYVRAPVSSVVLSGDGCQALGVVVRCVLLAHIAACARMSHGITRRDMTILAPCVISAAGALCTYTRLIPTAVRLHPRLLLFRMKLIILRR